MKLKNSKEKKEENNGWWYCGRFHHSSIGINAHRVFQYEIFCSLDSYPILYWGAFGGNRGLRPVPPEKGVFPLDHLHLGDLEKKEYLNRLKFAGHKSKECRHLYRKYLECRMEKAIAGI